MVAYRTWYARYLSSGERPRAGQLAAYLAAAIYALNPNLLYMQTTAMNEPIFLAFFIWALVYLDEFLRAAYPPSPDLSVDPAQFTCVVRSSIAESCCMAGR